MEQEKAIYLGAGKKQNGNWIKATLKAEVLNPDYWQEYKGRKFIKVNINIKDEPDKYGKDVSIILDTWKPEKTAHKATPLSETAQDFNESQSGDEEELSF